MRPSFCIFGLALAWLITSSAQAHSRGFAWFFAHSRPHGICSGQHVVATFYASGRRTASGQTFDPSGYAAAHRTLPFGSRVTVTNPRNGRSVTVVINDRGPFTRGVTLATSAASDPPGPTADLTTLQGTWIIKAVSCTRMVEAMDRSAQAGPSS